MSGWPTLAQALTAQWAVEDRLPVLVIGTLHAAWLTFNHSMMLDQEIVVMLVMVGLEATVMCLNIIRPTVYLRHRIMLAIGTRILWGAFPLLVDILRITGGPGTASGASLACDSTLGGDSGGLAAVADVCAAVGHSGSPDGLASLLQALIQLLVPVSWLFSLIILPVSIHLPPLSHVIAQATTVALLMRRAIATCLVFNARHSANAKLVSDLHWFMRHVVSLLCPGTREHLLAATQAISGAEKCTAVVWALQASLGFVLPTLLCWRSQLQAVRRHEAQQEQQWLADQLSADDDNCLPPNMPPSGTQLRRRRQDWGPPPQLDRSFTGFQYRQLCEPVLGFGATVGWPALVALAGLAAWVAATVRSSHMHRL